MSNKKTISLRDIKLLAQKSGNMCVFFRECRSELSIEGTQSDDAVIIGELAHICGEKLNAARYDEKMTDKQRNSVDNLIYLCPNCHTKIDKQKNSYSVEYLLESKRAHEAWVQASLLKAVTEITFEELQEVIKHLLEKSNVGEINFDLTPLNEKIKKNGLTLDINRALTIGLAKSKEVENFITNSCVIESDYAERLKAGFLKKYYEYRHKGLVSDDLFYELLNYASGNSSNFKRQAAGLSVIAYFFEKCEIFEK